MIKLKKPIATIGKDERVLRIPPALLDRDPFAPKKRKTAAKRKTTAAKSKAAGAKRKTTAKRK